MATRDSLFAYPSNSQSDYFFQAMANAKLSGAAAWCFHTEVAVDFNDGGPPFLEDRLRAHPEPEWAFVNALETRVTLRTSNGSNYVTAEGGGGGTVRADRTAAGPWETFTVTVLSGGPMLSGDRVALLAADGTHWLQATGGGGSSLRAAGQAVGAWETFVVQSVSGDVIRSGDPIAIRAGDPWYVVADGGGGGTVSATSVARGPWETFTVAFVGR